MAKLRSDLDSKLENIYGSRESRKEERKELSKVTRELKSMNKNDKLSSLGNVLKCYQKHIDSLTKDFESIEKSFLMVYKILTDAPDPVDALQSAQLKLLECKKYFYENIEIKEKLLNYEREFKELKNQEITVRKLEKQIQDNEIVFNNRLNEEKLKESNEISNKYSSLLNKYENSEKELKLTIESQKIEIISLQKQIDITQSKLLSLNLENEETLNIEESAKTMLEEELDRANSIIIKLQNEHNQMSKLVVQLQKQLAENQVRQKNERGDVVQSSNDTSHGSHTSISLNLHKQQLIEYGKENSRLKNELSSNLIKHSREIESLENNNKRLQLHNDKLRLQLSQLPSQDEYIFLKDKISKLQKQFLLETNDDEDSNEEDGIINDDINNSNDNNDGRRTGRNSLLKTVKNKKVELSIDASMDTLFYQKSRKLESQMTKYKLDYYKKCDELRQCQNEMEQLKDKNSEQSLLISKLENDLAQSIGNNENRRERDRDRERGSVSATTPSGALAIGAATLTPSGITNNVVIDIDDNGNSNNTLAQLLVYIYMSCVFYGSVFVLLSLCLFFCFFVFETSINTTCLSL